MGLPIIKIIIHIIIKMAKLKDKERIPKATIEKQLVTYKGGNLSSGFSTEAYQSRRDWHEIFKVIFKARTYNPGYFTQQGYHLKLKEK